MGFLGDFHGKDEFRNVGTKGLQVDATHGVVFHKMHDALIDEAGHHARLLGNG